MNSEISCSNCGSKIANDVPEAMIITRLLDDIGGSLAVLKGGLGCVMCPACHDFTTTPFHHLVVGDECSVIGIRAGRGDGPALLRAAQATGQSGVSRSRLVAAEDSKSFRRAVISELLPAYFKLLNQFATADDPMEWVRANEAALGPRFFVAMWLSTTGVFPLYTEELRDGIENVPSFVPDEIAPDAARHVVRRSEAIEHQERSVGRLVGYVMTNLALQCVPERSLAPLIERLPKVVPPIALADEVLASASEWVDSVIESASTKQERGWILLCYLLEAAFALICLEHGKTNPRQERWSLYYLLYDLHRRLDGNDDVLLPSVETLHRTIDGVAFWHGYRKLGAQARADTVPERGRLALRALFEAAGRVFPEELEAQTPIEIRFDEALDDGVILHRVSQLLTEAMGPPPNWVQVRAVIAGVSRTRPAIVPPLVARISEADPPSPELTRLSLYRMFIEHLNANGRHRDTAELMVSGMALLDRLKNDPDARGDCGQFLNEMGNCLRLLDRLAESQACYEEALDLIGGDESDRNRRVALRNLAIVLREQHRYIPATAAFERLLVGANPSEMPGLVTSLAICLNEVGMTRKALELMEEHARHIAGRQLVERGVIEYITQQAFLLAQVGKLREGLELLQHDGLRAEASHRNYHPTGLTARDIELRLGGQDAATRQRLIEEQHDLFAHLRVGRLGAALLSALQGLDLAATDAGDADRAEAPIRRLLGLLDPAKEPRTWLLHCWAAAHARRRGLSWTGDIERAVLDFQRGIASAAASGDVREFVSPQSTQVRELVSAVLAIDEASSAHAQRLWRHAADLGAAPVLTSNMRQAASLGAAFESPDPEDVRLGALLARRNCAFVQIAAAESGLQFVQTRVDAAGSPRTVIVNPGIPLDEATSIVRMLAFRLVRADPTASDLGLAAVGRWASFAERVRAGFAGMPAGQWAIVVAGPVQEAAVLLALAGTRPVSFVPSLAAATALRERDRIHRPPKGPRKLFGFATWFARERDDEAAALASVADHVSRLGRLHGLDASSVTATEASKERLIKGLTSSDVAWIACHGRIRREVGAVELLVAAEGRLPPPSVGMGKGLADDQYAVGWEALAAIPKAPEVVLSSACDSGLTITNLGGERLGLERAFLPAGTSVFVAPLWPVPTVAIQSVVARLLEARLREPEFGWAEHLHWMREPCLRDGLPALAVEALAVFGELPT